MMQVSGTPRPRDIDKHFGDDMCQYQPVQDTHGFTIPDVAALLGDSLGNIYSFARLGGFPTDALVSQRDFFTRGTGPEPLVCASYVYDLLDSHNDLEPEAMAERNAPMLEAA